MSFTGHPVEGANLARVLGELDIAIRDAMGDNTNWGCSFTADGVTITFHLEGYPAFHGDTLQEAISAMVAAVFPQGDPDPEKTQEGLT